MNIPDFEEFTKSFTQAQANEIAKNARDTFDKECGIVENSVAISMEITFDLLKQYHDWLRQNIE